MKKIFFFSIALLFSLAANCQDLIIKKSGEEIKAKVMEVGTSDIKYKRFDFQDGPVYTISKGEVIMVRYENGINEVMTTTNTSPANPTVQQPTVTPPVQEKVSNKIESSGGSFRQNGRYISKARVIGLLNATNDPEITRLLRKAENKKTTGTIVGIGLGLPLIIIGSLTTMRGVVVSNSQVVDPDGNGIIAVGGAMIGAGIMLNAFNIGCNVRANRLVEDAVALYNTKYADQAVK